MIVPDLFLSYVYHFTQENSPSHLHSWLRNVSREDVWQEKRIVNDIDVHQPEIDCYFVSTMSLGECI